MVNKHNITTTPEVISFEALWQQISSIQLFFTTNIGYKKLNNETPRVAEVLKIPDSSVLGTKTFQIEHIIPHLELNEL